MAVKASSVTRTRPWFSSLLQSPAWSHELHWRVAWQGVCATWRSAAESQDKAFWPQGLAVLAAGHMPDRAFEGERTWPSRAGIWKAEQAGLTPNHWVLPHLRVCSHIRCHGGCSHVILPGTLGASCCLGLGRGGLAMGA